MESNGKLLSNFLFLIITTITATTLIVAGCSRVQAPQSDTTPPSAPKGLYALPEDKAVYLHFTGTKESDIDAYNVYRSEISGSGFVKIGVVSHESYYTGYSFADNSVSNGKIYYYKVSSIDKNGNESSLAGQIDALPMGCSLASSSLTNQYNDVFFLSDSNGWVVGSGKTILHYNGSNWLKISPPLESGGGDIVSATSVFFSSPNDGWITTQYGSGEVWHYNGTKWSVAACLKDQYGWGQYLLSSYFLSSNDGWVGGGMDSAGYGYIAHYNGVTWESVSLPPSIEAIVDISFASNNNGWAIDSYDHLLHYDGSTWSLVKGGGASGAFVFTLPPNYMWDGGNSGNLFGGDFFNGASWAYLPVGGISPMKDIFMFSSTEGWAIGNAQIWRCWNGNWFEIKSMPSDFFAGKLYFSSRTKGWAVSYWGKVYKFE